MAYTREDLEAFADELHMSGGRGGINPSEEQILALFERGGDAPSR